MEKSPSSVSGARAPSLRARDSAAIPARDVPESTPELASLCRRISVGTATSRLSWLAPCGIGLALALSGCGGAASKPAQAAPAPTPGIKCHLTPELVVTLPKTFVEVHNDEGEMRRFEPSTGFVVHGRVRPIPFATIAAEMREISSRDPAVRVEDKTRGKEHLLEFVVHEPSTIRQYLLILAQVSDGKRTVLVTCSGRGTAIRATCKETVDSVWFAPDRRTGPKVAPAGKRWLDKEDVYLLVPQDFLPDPHGPGVAVRQGESRVNFEVASTPVRISLAGGLGKRLKAEATAIGPEVPIEREKGFGSTLEVVRAVQTDEPILVLHRLFPISADSTALATCFAPVQDFQAQPKRCAALLDTLEVVTPTPLVNARAEGGSVVR